MDPTDKEKRLRKRRERKRDRCASETIYRIERRKASCAERAREDQSITSHLTALAYYIYRSHAKACVCAQIETNDASSGLPHNALHSLVYI